MKYSRQDPGMSDSEFDYDDLGCECSACGRAYGLNTSKAINQIAYCNQECEQSARDIESEYQQERENKDMAHAHGL
jgi:hypothetical protein